MTPRPKNPPDPRIKQFIDFAFETYRKKHEENLVISGADCGSLKRVMPAINDLEKLKIYWLFFLDYKGADFILKDATRDIKTFCNQIMRISQKCPRSMIQKNDQKEFKIKLEQTWEYLSGMLDSGSAALDYWSAELTEVKNMEQLVEWDNAFRAWKEKSVERKN